MKRSLSCFVARFTFAAMLLAFVAIWPATAQPCIVPDNGGGTVDLPPANCGYVSPDDLHIMIDGLPAGTTIRISLAHNEFFVTGSGPGGGLGGEVEVFDSSLCMDMEGTGLLAGFNRIICMVMNDTETHTGPRNAGDPVQTFPTEMFQLDGQIFGDPDFDLLRIEAGGAFGLPSPGETTLTDLNNGTFSVDSFFDITYTIEFVGKPGGSLAGFAGVTTDTVRMSTGEPADPDPNPCTSPDDGTGTAVLPPPGCTYLSPQDFHIALDNIDPGTTIIIDASHDRFLNPTVKDGGNLGGRKETFTSRLVLNLTGTGQLAGYNRQVEMFDVPVVVHTGPTGTDDVQMFPTEMVQMQGQLFGDPDFDLLRITAGSANGLPSSGMTTLTRLGPSGSDYVIDSFFDITYRIEYAGAPGGALSGMSGDSTATVRMSTGGPPGAGCPPIPAGLDTFPSTATLVIQPLLTGGPPIKVRLSSANLPDTVVSRGPQTGGTILTEMVALNLSGFHPDLGGLIQVQLDPQQPSLGQLTHVVQDPDTCELVSADSFFDVFTEISLPGLGQVWTLESPLHLEAKLTGLPLHDIKYENPFVDPVVVLGPGPGFCNFSGAQCNNDADCPEFPQGEVCILGPPQPVAEIVYELHHVDPPFPPPGIDCFDTWLDAEISIGDETSLVTLQGPAAVLRSPAVSQGVCDPSGDPCVAAVDCPPGETCIPGTAASIQTEILSMDLSGFHPDLGNINLKQSKARPSKGKVQSKDASGGTYPATAFFDVFFDIQLENTGLPPVHNDQALRVTPLGSSGQDGVRNLPPDPDTDFRGGSTCSVSGQPCNQDVDCPFFPNEVCGIPLTTEDGTPVGTIRNVSHKLHPPFDWQPPPPPDDYCFDSWLHLRITIFNPFCEEEIWLPGTFRIVRGGPQGIGAAIMKTLMAKAQFLGNTLCTGAVGVGLDPGQVSSGEITGLTPAEFFPADSFFDVFVQLDTGIGVLTAGGSTHMTTTINALPPDEGEIYFGPGTTIPIFSEDGTQIGEILEVSHQIHQRIECPFDHLSRITFQLSDVGGPDGDSPGSTEALTAATIFVTLPGGGGGLAYDVIGGDFGGGLFPSAFPGHTCLQDNGSGVLVDPAPEPPLGSGRYYVARELFDTFVGSWNGGGNQTGDRDVTLIACP